MAPVVPRATYRLQFHKDFGFDDAPPDRAVPRRARRESCVRFAAHHGAPGSTHGYDVIDFNRLNPELGDEAAFEALIAELRAHDMGLLLDFVPNHMGVGSDNPWWLDVLEWGPLSPYATFFDIDWEASARGVGGKLTLPVLGDQYGKVLEAGELKLQFDAAQGTFTSPITPSAFPSRCAGIRSCCVRPPTCWIAAAGRCSSSRTGSRRCSPTTGPAQGAVRRQEAFALKAALAEARSRRARGLDAAVAAQNGTLETFEALHALLEDQAYRLAYWRVASSRSTTGAFSTSTSWPACAWSRARCSRPPIACCCA